MWRKLMRALWPFGRHEISAESTQAMLAASRSHERAINDRCEASAQRAEADIWAAQVRDHNAANRYDIWLRQVMQGKGTP